MDSPVTTDSTQAAENGVVVNDVVAGLNLLGGLGEVTHQSLKSEEDSNSEMTDTAEPTKTTEPTKNLTLRDSNLIRALHELHEKYAKVPLANAEQFESDSKNCQFVLENPPELVTRLKPSGLSLRNSGRGQEILSPILRSDD